MKVLDKLISDIAGSVHTADNDGEVYYSDEDVLNFEFLGHSYTVFVNEGSDVGSGCFALQDPIPEASGELTRAQKDWDGALSEIEVALERLLKIYGEKAMYAHNGVARLRALRALILKGAYNAEDSQGSEERQVSR